MIERRSVALAALISLTALLNACGGDSHGAYTPTDEVAPTVVTNLAGNAGDTAVSLGWEEPETGTQPLSYDIAISPTAANATIFREGTRALIRGLNNDTTYTFSVTAKNNSGESSATTLLLKPTAITDTPLKITLDDAGDTNKSAGIFDASLLNLVESSTLWMTYSSVSAQSGGSFAHSTSLAYSNDSGATLTYAKAINQTSTTTITSRTIAPCGSITCSGRWSYEMPFLVDDKTDDPSKRFKLFALKYFVYQSISSRNLSTFFALGAIVMKTGASPDSISYSTESVVLSWDSTPQELSETNNIKNIDTNLNECTALIEGSATAYQDALDFVFACPNSDDTQKIILLRSTDHAKTFKYISTPLTVADAASADALYFSAPSLLTTESNAPVLMATPVINRVINGSTATQPAYSGCTVFPFADEETGALFRSNDVPLSILKVQAVTSHANGACAWDRGAGASGILMNDYDPSASEPFSISNTTKRL